jgi:hypothetical protein
MRKFSGSTLALAVVAAFVMASGCGSDGGGGQVASAGDPSASQQTQPAENNDERTRQYVNCLRDQGLDVPDPEPGAIKVRLPDRNEPGVPDALRACQPYAPDAGGGAVDESTELAAAREYAACMRANGMPDFPDPDPDKGAVFDKELASLPTFGSADRVCSPLLADARPGEKK